MFVTTDISAEVKADGSCYYSENVIADTKLDFVISGPYDTNQCTA